MEPDTGRFYLARRYSHEGLKGLGSAVLFNRKRNKPDWMPAVFCAEVGAPEYKEQLSKESGTWSQELMVSIINREFGLSEPYLISRKMLRNLESPPSNMLEPNHTLLYYVGSLQIVKNKGAGMIFSPLGLDLIAQGLIDWETGSMYEAAQKQIEAQQSICYAPPSQNVL